MQAVSGGTDEAYKHGLAGGGRHFMFGRIAQHRRAIGIGQNETRIFGHDFGWNMLRNGKKEPITMEPVFGPFLIDSKILDARFDLDDPDGTIIGKGDEIGPPAGSQRHFRHRNEAEARQKASCPPRNHQRGLGLAAIGGKNEVGIGHNDDFTGKLVNRLKNLKRCGGCIAGGFLLVTLPSIARPVRAAVAVIFAHNETNDA